MRPDPSPPTGRASRCERCDASSAFGFFTTFPTKALVPIRWSVRWICSIMTSSRPPTLSTQSIVCSRPSRRPDIETIGFSIADRPPLQFEYSLPQIQPGVLNLDRDSLENLPEGVDGTAFGGLTSTAKRSQGFLRTWEALGYTSRISARSIAYPKPTAALRRARVLELPSGCDATARSALGAGGAQLFDLAGDGASIFPTLRRPRRAS